MKRYRHCAIGALPAHKALLGIDKLRFYDIDRAATRKALRSLACLGFDMTACATAQEASRAPTSSPPSHAVEGDPAGLRAIGRVQRRSDRDHHPLAPVNGKIVRRGRAEGPIVSFPVI